MKTASPISLDCNDREGDSSRPALSQRFVVAASMVLFAAFVIALLALLTACSSDNNKPAEEAKPEPKGPELITARSAFQKALRRRTRMESRRQALPHRVGRYQRRQWARWQVGGLARQLCLRHATFGEDVTHGPAAQPMALRLAASIPAPKTVTAPRTLRPRSSTWHF